jgi:hypothetical protein
MARQWTGGLQIGDTSLGRDVRPASRPSYDHTRACRAYGSSLWHTPGLDGRESRYGRGIRTADGTAHTPKPPGKANSNRSPRYSVGPRMVANMGETPRKRWGGGRGIRGGSVRGDWDRRGTATAGDKDRRRSSRGTLRAVCRYRRMRLRFRWISPFRSSRLHSAFLRPFTQGFVWLSPYILIP